ncbi:hypothetical protein K8I85_13075 [bacterium]|nr:hypothetical protein [bacterium]
MRRRSDPRIPALYAAGVLALYAGTAALRFDLVREEIALFMALWERGGTTAARAVFYGVVLAGLLGFVTWIIARRPRPREDAAIVLFATALGWAAEAWGTRSGLWSYYTGETPPLWIVPAWPLGAIVVSRVADAIERISAPPAWMLRAHVMLATVTLAVFVVFVRPTWTSPWTAAAFGVLLAAFALRPRPERDVPFVLAGLVCVFFADFWGTGSACYRYHEAHLGASFARASGVLFGMLFDTGIVLAAARLGGVVVGSSGRRRSR